MSAQGPTLFDLLPALYRLRDAQYAQSLGLQQGPLQSLLMLVEEQFAILAEDLNQLYDDQFIETCAPWVIPYIGDLIRYQPVHGIATAIASPRAEVAHTISFRRRKGTILVLEQLARDVSGWGANAVEMFRVLAATQYMKQIRPANYFAPNLRSWQVRGYMDSGFDVTAHNVDVRLISSGEGRYNIQNVAVFLWSLNAYSVTNVPLTPVGAGNQFFRFSTLGADMPLFNNPVSQGPNINAAAQPVNVPDRLTRRVLCQDMQNVSGPVYYGPGNSLAIYFGDQLQNAYQVRVCNLSGADGSWINVPAAGGQYTVAVDPELGRVALAVPLSSGAPKASFYYGFNGDMGGGEYSSRADTFAVKDKNPVFPFPDTESSARYSTLQAAVTFALNNLAGAAKAAVEIADSGIYPLTSATTSVLQINVPAGVTFELRGAPGYRPTLLLGGEITATGTVTATEQSILALNGLLLAYAPPGASAPVPAALIHVPNNGTNQLSQLQINHCTLVPGLALTPQGTPELAGHPALVAELAQMQVAITKSIIGGIQAQQLAIVNISDSIVDSCGPNNVAYASIDGTSGGGSLTLQGCTVIGKVHATLFSLISNSIIWAALAPGDSWAASLLADRKQQGCLRFSFLPASAVVPRQFECVQLGEGAPRPVFYSLQYGDPGYGKLLPSTDDAIRRGADDGAEMGAFHFVLASLRETDLRVRLQEFLPVGLQCGIFYQN